MKIYTKTGDAGDTGLFGGARVSKASQRVDAYGDVDELNSLLGVVRAHRQGDHPIDAWLQSIQSSLLALGAELSCVPDKQVDVGIALIGDSDITELELHIDELERDLQPLTNFILPGGCPQAAFLHVARTTCRRGERKLVALSANEPVRNDLVRYLNRLSDLLFVAARHANFRAKLDDISWSERQSRE